MHIIIYSIIVLCATMIGAITGLGGGIIIKPAFDFVGIDTTSMISVYSTVAVFTMCLVSIYKRSKLGFHVKKQIALGLAFGSIIGGKIGDVIFLHAVESWGSQAVSATQSVILFLLLGGIILFTLNKERIRTLEVTNLVAIVTIGLTVGIISVYLGIGGGPLNIALLVYFFSMKAKDAAAYSILMIFFAQIIKMGTVIRDFEKYNNVSLVILAIAIFAVLGGWIGTKIQSKLTHEAVEKLYLGLMAILVFMTAFNVFKFIGV